jgi:uncharacterized membrane protein YfcA
MTYFSQLAGGGGLVVTPTLIAFGLPVPVALGTRRFSVLGGVSFGLAQFYKWKKVDLKFGLRLAAFTLAGSVIGYLIVDMVNDYWLKKIIGTLIVILAVVLMFEGSEKVKEVKGLLFKYKRIIGPPLAASAGLWAVLIGGGGGTVMTYVLIIVYGQSILESAGNRKLPLLTGHIVSTFLFIWAGYIYYPLALPLLVSNSLGGWFGSRFFLKKGEDKVKVVFFVIILILGFKTALF